MPGNDGEKQSVKSTLRGVIAGQDIVIPAHKPITKPNHESL